MREGVMRPREHDPSSVIVSACPPASQRCTLEFSRVGAFRTIVAGSRASWEGSRWTSLVNERCAHSGGQKLRREEVGTAADYGTPLHGLHSSEDEEVDRFNDCREGLVRLLMESDEGDILK